MPHRFHDLVFTQSVQAEQVRRGSRGAYASVGARDGLAGALLSPHEAAYIAARDSFYLASVSETGWPYIQHRGGPAGFVRLLEGNALGWADFAGNRQYVTVGNTAVDDRVALFFMDYPNQRRLKLLGHLRVLDPREHPQLAQQLAVPGARARVERLVVVTIEAFDWNCPQHITPRFTLAEIEAIAMPLHARIAELEAQVARVEPAPG